MPLAFSISLRFRILVGVAIFAILAAVDLIQHGRRATRWREYLFLIICTATAMLYGMLNDQITSRISWEYFYYGKELAPILGAQTPPDAWNLSLQAARIGAEATWSAGLVAGAVILFVNSLRSRTRGPVPYATLFALLLRIIALCILFSILLGAAGWQGWLTWMAQDFRDLRTSNLWRPQHFMLVYGIHLGGYVGALTGIIWTTRTLWTTNSRA